MGRGQELLGGTQELKGPYTDVMSNLSWKPDDDWDDDWDFNLSVVKESKNWMYHLSPAQNRESIKAAGLQGGEHDPLGTSPWAGMRQNAPLLHEQPPGNYFFNHPDDAHQYSYGFHTQVHKRYEDPENLIDHGIYVDEGGHASVEPEPPKDFHDWDSEAQDEWYENSHLDHEPFDHNNPNHMARLPKDNRGYDIWKTDVTGHDMENDPESRMGFSGEADEAKVLQGLSNPEDDDDDFEPTVPRWLVRDHIPPERVTHHDWIPPWKMTENNMEESFDDDDREHWMPEMLTRVPMNVTPRPPAAFSAASPSQPVQELKQWLESLTEPKAQLSPHHRTELDFQHDGT